METPNLHLGVDDSALDNTPEYMGQAEDNQKIIAECVGLWLAEGDSKSRSEITFTNSRIELVDLFYKTIKDVFKNYRYNPRIYFYSKDKKNPGLPYKECVVKCYVDKRTEENYFIFRVASVEMVKKWKEIVTEILSKRELSPCVLSGFFAGEGNIKETSHNSRVIRISQKIQKEFIDNCLKHLNIKYRYIPKEMSYNISGKWNWDIFAKLKLADLHPAKKDKFWKVYQNFKEEHYKSNFIKNSISNVLNEPKTFRQLAKIFSRTPARIQDVLIELKKEGTINNFGVGSLDYWTNDFNSIIISKLKKKYMLLLDKPKQTSELAEHFKVCWKSAFKRLSELQNLNLVRRQINGKWIKLQTKKKLIII